MKILVVGTGMYVTGRKTKGFGTIFPSIIEFQRMQKLKKIRKNKEIFQELKRQLLCD